MIFILLPLVLWGPGFAILATAGWGFWVALIGAPAISVALAGGGAIVSDWVGLPWGLPAFLGVTVIGVGIALFLRVVAGKAQHQRDLGGNARSNLLSLGGMIVGAAIQFEVALRGMPDLGFPLQNRDAVFHMNAVQAILSGGNGSSFGGLSAMYGGNATPTYPAAWHDLVSLVATPLTVVETSNLFALVVSAVVYPSGLALLARGLAGSRSWAGPVAPVIAAGALAYPPAVMLHHGQWPFGLSLALVPAVCAIALSASWRSWTAIVCVVVAAMGVILAQPSGAGVLVVVAACVLVGRLVVVGIKRMRHGHAIAGAATILGVAAGAALLTLAAMEVLSRMGMNGFDRPSSSRGAALWSALTLETLKPFPWSETAHNWGALALLATGVLAISVRRVNPWPILAWVSFVALSALAVGPDGKLRSLTAVWYKDELRTRAILVVFAVILCAVGMGWLADLVADRLPVRWKPVGAATIVFLLLGVLAMTTQGAHRTLRLVQWVAPGYQEEYMLSNALASEDELSLIRSLDAALPDDAVIIGDPLSGAVLVQALTGRTVLIPVVGDSGLNRDQRFVRDHFSSLDEDDEVCAALDRLDPGGRELYLYWREPKQVFLGAIPQARGFVDVEDVPGLDLVASDGDVMVSRVAACD